MLRRLLFLSATLALGSPSPIAAHCQMPCGIYHDDMVYDQVDQYVETMYKGISVLNNNPFDTAKERNEFVRWVIQKENASDDVAELILKYFLQQKIKADEAETPKMLAAAHKLLQQLVAIKQNTDLKMVEEFAHQWEHFKLFFHREGYECQMEKIKLGEDADKRAELEKGATGAAGATATALQVTAGGETAAVTK